MSPRQQYVGYKPTPMVRVTPSEFMGDAVRYLAERGQGVTIIDKAFKAALAESDADELDRLADCFARLAGMARVRAVIQAKKAVMQ